MRTLALKLGANYLWGLFNYTLGVACGAAIGGLYGSPLHDRVETWVNHHSITSGATESRASTHLALDI